MTRPEEDDEGLRMPWSMSARALPRLALGPLRSFLQTEASGGIALLAAAAVALAWANSPWSSSYETLWHTRLTIGVGSWSIAEDLRHWINDGLMAVFFFVVGLEIKRELTSGELTDRRTAALPVFAAVGGMVGPAVIYLALTSGSPGSGGWGIPVATDIAFALGVLALVGRGIPSSLRLFLLSLAIVDDIGAILLIAMFYTDRIVVPALFIAAGLVVVIVVLRSIHVRAAQVYVALGLGVWLAFYASGVHATIAGVILGILTPALSFQRPHAVSARARRIADETADRPEPPDADAGRWLELSKISNEAVSPLARLEHALHPWTSFVIVPLFALANAGVDIRGDAVARAFGSRVTWGIILGLVFGKIIGITAASWLAVKARACVLPAGVSWSQLVAVAAVAGIGFTVSIFIAGLAFDDGAALDDAKIGVLVASVVAGVAGSAMIASRARKG